MAKLALVYGMRLFPAEDLGEVSEAVITLKDGRESRVTMHLIEGSKEQIEQIQKPQAEQMAGAIKWLPSGKKTIGSRPGSPIDWMSSRVGASWSTSIHW